MLAIIPLLFLIPSISTLFMNAQQNSVPYSFFTQQLEDGNVRSITVQEETVTGVLSSEVTYQDQPVTEFQTYIPRSVSGEYLDRIDQEGVEVNTLPTPDNSGLAILLNLLPFAITIWWRRHAGHVQRGQEQGQEVSEIRQRHHLR